MKMKDVAPLILEKCLQYLAERPINTRYHPRKDEYVLDTYMMARIIRYDGNLQATVTQADSLFCNKVLKDLVEEQIIKVPLSNKKFSVIGDENKKRFTIYVKKMTLFSKDGFKPDLRDIVASLEDESNGITSMGKSQVFETRI